MLTAREAKTLSILNGTSFNKETLLNEIKRTEEFIMDAASRGYFDVEIQIIVNNVEYYNAFTFYFRNLGYIIHQNHRMMGRITIDWHNATVMV